MLEVDKSWRNADLLEKLEEMYSDEGFITRFYYEEKKELKPISKDNWLVSGPTGSRNILQIVIVELIPI